MALEYQTLKFQNDASGLKEKDRTMARWSANGWWIVSESIEPGHMKGGQMCCFASICLPVGALAGRSAGHVVVTIAHEADPSASQQHPAIQHYTSVGPTTWGPAIGSAMARLVKWSRRNPLWAILLLAVTGMLIWLLIRS